MGRVIGNPILAPLREHPAVAASLARPGAHEGEDEILLPLLDSVGRWARSEVDAAEIDATGRIPPKLLDAAGELGLFGLTIPADHGGADLSLKAACRVVEELAGFDASVAITVGLHGGMGVQGLLLHGSEGLRRELLPDLASGRSIAALAATEPGAGSDLSAIATVARRVGGDRLALRGSKLYVTNGGIAGVFTVVARMWGADDARQPYALVLLRAGDPGLRVGAEERKLGLRGSSTTALDMDDVTVGSVRLLGSPTRGLDPLYRIFARGRVVLAAGSVGVARSALADAIGQVVRRRQFGSPIGQFGQVREMIAHARSAIFAMESVVRLAAAPGSETDPELVWKTEVAKVFCTEAAHRVVDDALQLHGGSGFLEPTRVARSLRDIRVTRIFDGANEVLRCQIAARAFLFRYDGDWPRPGRTLHPALAADAEHFERLVGMLEERTNRLLEERGSSLFADQLTLRDVSEAAIGLYVWLAVLLRMDALLRSGGELRDQLHLTRYVGLVLGRRVGAGLSGRSCDEHSRLVDRISDEAYAALVP